MNARARTIARRRQNVALRTHQTSGLTLQQPSFYGVPLTLDADTVRYIVTHLKALPAKFAEDGKTMFVDLDIYEDQLPESITDIWALCISASSSAPTNEALLTHVLDTKTTKLIRSAKTQPRFSDLLASVQAFVLVLIIRLFACKISRAQQQPQNDALLDILGQLTLRLWQQAPTQISASLSPCQAWLFAESVRRTILTSYLLRGTYSVIRHGYLVHTAFVEALPFDIRTTLWDSISTRYCDDSVRYPVTNIGTKMVSYREYTDMWDFGQIHGATTFGKLLLVACKGKEVVKKGLPMSFVDIET